MRGERKRRSAGPPRPQVIAALVGATAVVSAALSVVVVDQSRRADRALAVEVKRSGTVFRRVIYRFERSKYEDALLRDVAQLANLHGSVTTPRLRHDAVHAVVRSGLKSLALSVSSFDREQARRKAEEAADLRLASPQFAAHDRYAGRATEATVGLGLAALAGAVVGLAAVLRSRRASWIAVTTSVAALVGAIGLGVAALV